MAKPLAVTSAAVFLLLLSGPASAFTPSATTCAIEAARLAPKIYKDAMRCAAKEQAGTMGDRYSACWQNTPRNFVERYGGKANTIYQACSSHLDTTCGDVMWLKWSLPTEEPIAPCHNPGFDAWATFDSITPPNATTCRIQFSTLAAKVYTDAMKCARREHAGKVPNRFQDCWAVRYQKKYVIKVIRSWPRVLSIARMT